MQLDAQVTAGVVLGQLALSATFYSADGFGAGGCAEFSRRNGGLSAAFAFFPRRFGQGDETCQRRDHDGHYEAHVDSDN